MKNYNLSDVIGFDVLYNSTLKCKKGVLWKNSVANYRLNIVEKTIKLSDQLATHKYKARPPIHFKIMSPKPREIASITFRDRVYQRSLNDNVVYPIMSKSFIYDNYACQKGKGTDAARERLKEMLRKHYRKHGLNGYVAQFDIKGYYPNMNHAMTEQLFKKKLPPEIFALVQRILQEQYKGDKGYNPGSQLIQIAGISVLDGYDHFVKEQLHAKFYIRYMDDFLIISENKKYLENCLYETIQFLKGLNFEVNKKKTKIYSISEGIPFLGFTFKLTKTGKVLMLINSENVKREYKKLYRLVKKSINGFLPKEKVDESYAAWRNHASKGNTFKLLSRTDKYYNNLWRNLNGVIN